MRFPTLIATLIVASGAFALFAWAQQPKPPAVPTKAPAVAPASQPAAQVAARQADEQAIRAIADAFAKAYNDHDPVSLAALFTKDGELIDTTGDIQAGHGAIGAVFAAAFEDYPEAQMSIQVESIRFPGPNLAVEDGVTSVVYEADGEAELSHYSAVHVKQPDGKWLTASVRDLPETPRTPRDQLEQLAWLIGEWVDESPDSLVTTTYEWSDNENYILSKFDITIAGEHIMSGSQRIGWDPLGKVIRSWVFDSEGGFGQGVFSREGDTWIVKMTSVTREGEPASATQTLSRVGPDSFTWDSRDRMVGGSFEAPIEQITVARKPPQPE